MTSVYFMPKRLFLAFTKLHLQKPTPSLVWLQKQKNFSYYSPILHNFYRIMYNIHMEQYFKVKVHADEKKNKIVQKTPDTFEIWVKAPAQEGRANEAVRALLAEHLQLPENKLSLIKGATSPAKIFLRRD